MCGSSGNSEESVCFEVPLGVIRRILTIYRQMCHACVFRYYLDKRNCTEKDFYNPNVLDKFLRELEAANDVLDKTAPGIPRWLGETGSAFGGGAPGLSDRYVAGFM